ncbi:cell division protein FtsA [Candidatus Gracilibacteria bacterium GN02-872]|nr:cell division protein FtsA [Candidatus Gracilibacteria bacterium GN02-872]RKW24682.1 MAG: cell division protein FtsA [Candidatus Gracilibacteria bacterium]
MSASNTVTTIDIGSSKIRTIIGYFDKENNNDFHILGIGIANSNAIRKGNILDMEEFKNNLDSSLEEAEKMAGEQVNGAFISFNISGFEVIKSKGIISISGSEVTEDDIDRALEKATTGVEIQNKEILKVIPESFVVDLEEGIKNPVGMKARKLEVVTNIFSMNANTLSNIKKAIADIGIEVLDCYPNLLSSPEGVLTKRQKELGVVCIDIGASTTGVTVYENGVLNYSAVIPLGGDNVTNDIALGLRTSTVIAEKVKLEYAELDLENKEDFKDSSFDLSELGTDEIGEVSREYLSKIVTARYEEIFFFVREELKKIGRDGMLPEGAICVGGASKMKGFTNLARTGLRLPVFIGLPVSKDDLVDASISDPEFSAVIGTMVLSNLYNDNYPSFSFSFKGLLESIKKLFKKILPK